MFNTSMVSERHNLDRLSKRDLRSRSLHEYSIFNDGTMNSFEYIMHEDRGQKLGFSVWMYETCARLLSNSWMRSVRALNVQSDYRLEAGNESIENGDDLELLARPDFSRGRQKRLYQKFKS